jgi:hypothetical protein
MGGGRNDSRGIEWQQQQAGGRQAGGSKTWRRRRTDRDRDRVDDLPWNAERRESELSWQVAGGKWQVADTAFCFLHLLLSQADKSLEAGSRPACGKDRVSREGGRRERGSARGGMRRGDKVEIAQPRARSR